MVEAEQVINKAKEQKRTEKKLLRPVAEFFHEHEGKLFERYEAIDKLVSSPKINSTDKRILARVIGNLCDDRVDPVQNIVRESEKWVGVIEYSEHNYWYEYTEHNDVEGRINVGICAKCVKKANSDTEVAKGVGTTEELSNRIKRHYKENHNGKIENVETGATLVSGTTIAGNTAIHTGNDGLGSGLSADTIQGKEAITENTTLNKSLIPAGTVKTKFATPDGGPEGVGLDSNDSIWHFADFDDKIYQLDQSGTKISNFATPSTNGMGVGINSNDSIWHGAKDLSSIIQFDRSGSQLKTFATPSSGPQGISLDSKDCIWHIDGGANSIYHFDQNGTQIGKVSAPAGDPRGLGINSEDSIFTSDTDKASIWRLTQNTQGDTSIADTVSKFNSPSNRPRGLGVDSNDNIWQTDDSHSIYQMYSEDHVKYE